MRRGEAHEGEHLGAVVPQNREGRPRDDAAHRMAHEGEPFQGLPGAAVLVNEIVDLLGEVEPGLHDALVGVLLVDFRGKAHEVGVDELELVFEQVHFEGVGLPAVD